MDDIGSDRYMDRHRNPEPLAGCQQTRPMIRKLFLATVDIGADRLADSFPVFCAADDRFVQHAAGFFRHPEPSLVDFSVDFLRRVPHERQLEVMNDPRAVHGHGRHDLCVP